MDQRETFAGQFRRPSSGDTNRTPQTSSETEFPPPPPTSARRDVVEVWTTEVQVSHCGSTLTARIDYPSGVDMCSDEVPGWFGDKPDLSCTIGGVPAHVTRFLRGTRCMGIEVLVPESVNLADPRGQVVSLVWMASRPELKNSVVKRVRAKKA